MQSFFGPLRELEIDEVDNATFEFLALTKAIRGFVQDVECNQICREINARQMSERSKRLSQYAHHSVARLLKALDLDVSVGYLKCRMLMYVIFFSVIFGEVAIGMWALAGSPLPGLW